MGKTHSVEVVKKMNDWCSVDSQQLRRVMEPVSGFYGTCRLQASVSLSAEDSPDDLVEALEQYFAHMFFAREKYCPRQ